MIDLPDNVRLARLSPQVLEDYWNRLKKFDRIFTDGTRGNFEDFRRRWMSPDMVVLEIDDGEGLITFDRLEVGLKARIHGYFFDKKLSTRRGTLEDILLWAFFQFDLQRIDCWVPAFAHGLRRFMKTIKAVHEGTLRKYEKFFGQPEDVFVFSLLREELLCRTQYKR